MLSADQVPSSVHWSMQQCSRMPLTSRCCVGRSRLMSRGNRYQTQTSACSAALICLIWNRTGSPWMSKLSARPSVVSGNGASAAHEVQIKMPACEAAAKMLLACRARRLVYLHTRSQTGSRWFGFLLTLTLEAFATLQVARCQLRRRHHLQTRESTSLRTFWACVGAASAFVCGYRNVAGLAAWVC